MTYDANPSWIVQSDAPPPWETPALLIVVVFVVIFLCSH